MTSIYTKELAMNVGERYMNQFNVQKVKCDMETPSCSQCIGGRRTCKYDRPIFRKENRKRYAPLLETRSIELERQFKESINPKTGEPPTLIDETLLGYFFKYVNCFLGVVHAPTFLENVTRQPQSLLYIMYALGRLYHELDVGNSYVYSLPDHYFKLSQSSIQLHEKTTVNTCLKSLLTTYYCLLRGKSHSWVLSQALLVQQAHIVGLHKPFPSSLSEIQKATRSRIWWSIYCMDRLMTIINPEITSHMPNHSYPIPLPLSDKTFYALGDVESTENKRSLRGHLTTLFGINSRIIDQRNHNVPHKKLILEACLSDWYMIAEDSIMTIDINDSSMIQDLNYEYWLIIYIKSMFYSSYLYLYDSEFQEMCTQAILSPEQMKIFQQCISSASSIAAITFYSKANNPSGLYLDPFMPFCKYMAGKVFSNLKRSPHHSNAVSGQEYICIRESLRHDSKHSEFAGSLLRKLDN